MNQGMKMEIEWNFDDILNRDGIKDNKGAGLSDIFGRKKKFFCLNLRYAITRLVSENMNKKIYSISWDIQTLVSQWNWYAFIKIRALIMSIYHDFNHACEDRPRYVI